METYNKFDSFCDCHHKVILFIDIYDIDALVSLEKLFFPPFFLIIKVCPSNETLIPIIVHIPFVIGHHKHDIKALVSPEKLSVHHCS